MQYKMAALYPQAPRPVMPLPTSVRSPTAVLPSFHDDSPERPLCAAWIFHADESRCGQLADHAPPAEHGGHAVALECLLSLSLPSPSLSLAHLSWRRRRSVHHHFLLHGQRGTSPPRHPQQPLCLTFCAPPAIVCRNPSQPNTKRTTRHTKRNGRPCRIPCSTEEKKRRPSKSTTGTANRISRRSIWKPCKTWYMLSPRLGLPGLNGDTC
jgi:hypothetical protein